MAQTMFGDVFSARQTGMEDLEKSAATLAALQPGRGSVYAAGMAGGMLGRGIGQAFGAHTPAEAKQAKMQEIQAQFGDLDMSQPENMRKVQSAFWQAGLYDQADKVADMINERITAEKTTASQEREALLKQCNESGDPNSRACQMYDAKIASEKGLAAYRGARVGAIGVKTERERRLLDLGMPELEAQKIASDIQSVDAKTLHQLILNQDEPALRELERRQKEADLQFTETKTKLTFEQAREVSVDVLIKEATKGDAIAQEALKARKLELEGMKIDAATKKLIAEAENEGRPEAKAVLLEEGRMIKGYMEETEVLREKRRLKKELDMIKTDPSAMDDTALIFKFMKMLDPASVVRESEQEQVESARGKFEGLGALYRKWKSGERLTDKQRSDIIRTMDGLFASEMQLYGEVQEKYRKRVDSANKRHGWNIDVDNIVFDVAPELSGGDRPPQATPPPTQFTPEQIAEEKRRRGLPQ